MKCHLYSQRAGELGAAHHGKNAGADRNEGQGCLVDGAFHRTWKAKRVVGAAGGTRLGTPTPKGPPSLLCFPLPREDQSSWILHTLFFPARFAHGPAGSCSQAPGSAQQPRFMWQILSSHKNNQAKSEGCQYHGIIYSCLTPGEIYVYKFYIALLSVNYLYKYV